MKARCLIELFNVISHSFRLKPIARNTTWTPAGDWYSNFSRSRELSESLHLERERSNIQWHILRYGAGCTQPLNPPRQGSSPFHFTLAHLQGVNRSRVQVVDRLYRLVLHFGLALMSMLLKYDLIAGSYPNEVRERQIRGLAEHDVSN